MRHLILSHCVFFRIGFYLIVIHKDFDLHYVQKTDLQRLTRIRRSKEMKWQREKENSEADSLILILILNIFMGTL